MRLVAITSICLAAGLPSADCAGSSTEAAEDSTNVETVPQTNPGVSSAGAADVSDGGSAEAGVSVFAPFPSSGSSSVSAGGTPPASLDASSISSADASGSSTPSTSAPSNGDASTAPSHGGSNADAAAGSEAASGVSVGGGSVIAGCSVFPANNPWNTRVDDTAAYPVHPNSDTYIASMSPSTHLHADWGDWSVDHFGIPWQTVPGSQAFVPMTFSEASESDPGPYPFPPTALVEGGAGSGGDMHVLVLDTGTCTLYETWDSTFVGPGWSCGSGAIFNLSSNTLRPDGWTSADAAGLPILPGLVRLAEVQAGSIQHALRFTIESTQQGYIHPATHAAGTANASLPPMGLRLRLKASFDLSGFSGPALVILTAMQQYGLILADNGGNWFVTGDSDDGWTPLMDAITSAFSQVDGSDFEAVYTGAISTAGL